jgi:hypothetical protein
MGFPLTLMAAQNANKGLSLCPKPAVDLDGGMNKWATLPLATKTKKEGLDGSVDIISQFVFNPFDQQSNNGDQNDIKCPSPVL